MRWDIIDGNILPKERNIVCLFNPTIDKYGGHGEDYSESSHYNKVKDQEITAAVIRLNPWFNDSNMMNDFEAIVDIEFAQAMGFPHDPERLAGGVDPRYSPDLQVFDFSPEFYDCGRYNYSRFPGTLTPDETPNYLNQ